MSTRVTEQEVRDIMPESVDDALSLLPFITTASLLVTRLNTACPANITITTEELKEIERWLAAHFTAIREEMPQSENYGGASKTVQGQTAMNIDATLYGQQAKMMDPTGFLAKLGSGKKTFSLQTINPVSDV